MSLNLILHEKKISERQFIGDLTNLFARYRISPRGACAFANFESRFALSEAFRSKLFTLCTAISHMSEADLTGEQLLMLIASALGTTETSDVGPELSEWLREEFKDGYDAWSARDLTRDLTKADGWQIPPLPANLHPMASQPAEEGVELAGDGPQTSRDVQDSALLPSSPAPQLVAAVNLQHRAPDEKTTLHRHMERRIQRLKPHIQSPAGVASTRKQAQPAVVVPVARAGRKPVHIDHDAFLARHPYLVPEQRVVPASRVSGDARPGTIPSADPVRTVASPLRMSQPVRISPPSPPPVEATGTNIAGPYPRTAPELHRAQRPPKFNPSAGRFWVSLRAAVGGIAASVSLVILAGSLGGIVLYPNAVADYFSQPSRVDPHMQKGAEPRQFAANPQITSRGRANSRASRIESVEDSASRK